MEKSLTLKEHLTVSIKGVFIGFVSLAIPGLSAGTFALVLGIYYMMIDALSNILKDFRKSMSFLLFLMIGYAVGALIGAFSMNALYEEYPLIVVFVIFGFILGTAVPMIKKLAKHAKKFVNWFVFACVIAVILTYTIFLTQGEPVSLDPGMTIFDYIKLGIVGLVTSVTTVVPGFDFAIVCISLGYYYSFLGALTNLVTFTEFFHSLIVVAVYLAGNVTGMILFSKLVKKITALCPVQIEFASAGFVVATPFVVFRNCITDNPNFSFAPGQFVFGAFMSVIAFSVVSLVYYMSDKKQNDPRPAGRKKRNMLRFFYTIALHPHLAILYTIRLRKITLDKTMTREQKYIESVKVLKGIDKHGRIYPRVYGKENLVRDKGVLIVANHQGRYDGIGIFTALDDYPCSVIMDKAVLRTPILKWFARSIDMKLLDKADPRQGVQEVKRMADDIQSGRSNILFPEGDWADNKNTLQEFYTGGLSAAYKSKCDITPIVLYDTYKVYGVSSLKKIYPEVHILPPVRYETYKDMTKPELAAFLKNIIQEKLNELYVTHPDDVNDPQNVAAGQEAKAEEMS